MFGAELAFKEPSKALYALTNASCFQSGTSRSFPFSRRSSTREKTGKDGVTRHGKRRREKHFPSPHLLFCSVCSFLAASFRIRHRFLFSMRLTHMSLSSRGERVDATFYFPSFVFSAVLSPSFFLSVFTLDCRRESICNERENL